MSKECSLCKKNIGSFDNHGSDTNPLCFKCAHMKAICEKCNKQVELLELIGHSDKRICKKCRKEIEEENETRQGEKQEQEIVAEGRNNKPSENVFKTVLTSKPLLILALSLALIAIAVLIYASTLYFNECNTAIFGREHLFGFMFGRAVLIGFAAFIISLLFKQCRSRVVISLLCIGVSVQAGFKSYEMIQSVIHTRTMVQYIPSIVDALMTGKPIDSYHVPETAWKSIDPFAKWLQKYTGQVQALRNGMQNDIAAFGIDNILSAESMKSTVNLLDSRRRLHSIDSVISTYEERTYSLTNSAVGEISSLKMPQALKTAILQGFRNSQEQTILVLKEFYSIEHDLIKRMENLIGFVISKKGQYSFLLNQIFFFNENDNKKYIAIVNDLTKLAQKEAQIQQRASNNINRSAQEFKNTQ